MSELKNYSKKQINPLIEKYRINPEKNMLFQSIISMFDNQTNYQVWALKSVFENAAQISDIQDIKRWSDENKTEIKLLTKGNIVCYKTANDFDLIKKEMDGLDIIKRVKDAINMFNTRQRKMMTDNILKDINNGIDAINSESLKEWFAIFKKMLTLVSHRREKLISTSSAIDDISFLKQHITDALNETYEWNKDDMLGFMARNASDCAVTYNEGNIVVVQVPSFKSAKELCGNGRTGWCLTRDESYFKRYVFEAGGVQYFLFDFGVPEDNEFAHVGFTVKMDKGIIYAHSSHNKAMVNGGSVLVGGKKVTIYDLLRDDKVPSSAYIHLKPLNEFKWDVDAFLKYVSEKCNGNAQVRYSNDNIVIVRANTNDTLKKLISHTLIKQDDLFIDNTSKTYIIYNFGESKDDENSVVGISYVKDRYNYDNLSAIVNAFGNSIKGTNYLEKIGIKTDMFLEREKISNDILLHKLIDENLESEAIDLINKASDSININYTFLDTAPIFKAIANRMINLFKVIINHKNFDNKICDVFCEPLLQALMYQYTSSDKEEDMSKIKQMIDIVIESKTFDLNVTDQNLDTPLNVSCQNKKFLWITKKLLKNDNVNPNVINDVCYSALSNAIRTNNIEAIKSLGKRNDLVIRAEDIDLAEQFELNLEDILGTEFVKEHTVNDSSKGSSSHSVYDIDFAKLLAAVMKVNKR